MGKLTIWVSYLVRVKERWLECTIHEYGELEYKVRLTCDGTILTVYPWQLSVRYGIK